MKVTTKLILTNIVLYVIFGIIIYPIVPYLLNYPPNSIDNDFQISVVGMQYTVQFILLLILGIVMNVFSIYLMFRKLNLFDNKKDQDIKLSDIKKIRNISANGIYRLIPLQEIMTAIIMFAVLTLTSSELELTIKLTGIICIWVAISDLLLFVFTNKIFHKILKETYVYLDDDKKDNIIRLSIKNKMLLQCMSIMLVIVFIMTLFGYSRILHERGEFLKEKEQNELNDILENNSNNIIGHLKNKDQYFVLYKDGSVIVDNADLSEFSIKYIIYNQDYNRTYNQYGSSQEGVFKKIVYNNETYFIGKMYEVMPTSYTLIYLFFDLILMIIYIVIINYFAKNIKYELDKVSEGLSEIKKSSNNNVIGKKLPITSNDELSDIITSYNSIQELTEEYLKEIRQKQEVIVKQEQLVSIGELAGGVAHDINTPISAIKTGILMLNEMTGQRTDSEKEILLRMDNCATKIINIVNSMRNQIRNLGGDTNVEFKISSVVNDIKIITYHEIFKNKSEVIIDIQDDISVTGDPTKLGQVLTNLVVNGSQAYGASGGKIEVTVKQFDENTAMIIIRDYAGGLDEKIKPYIFKNILTTKGTSGTGLGLYLAYSVIKGNFNGEITFESEIGTGTTFIIKIPKAGVIIPDDNSEIVDKES